MATAFIKTTGNAANSGCTDTDLPLYSGTAASEAAGVVTLDGSPDLSVLVLSGTLQSTIFINDATNSNQKIFKITAVDNVAKTVTVTPEPTGTISASTWRIGGRHVWTPASIEGMLAAGDRVEIQDDIASAATTILTARTAGDATTGYVKVYGKTGVLPKLTCSSTPDCVTGNVAFIWLENFEVIQQGASGAGINLSGTAADNWVIRDVKVSDAGGNGITIVSGATACRMVGVEVSGTGAHAISIADTNSMILWSYLHDTGGTGDGINLNSSTATQFICWNIIDTCAGRGLLKSGTSTHVLIFVGNIVNACGNTGFENANASMLVFMNNILRNNGNASGEYNVEPGSMFMALSIVDYNCLYTTGGGGSQNYSANYTPGSHDIETDPLFVDPDNGNFALQSTSPCKATGYPSAFAGGLSTSYVDMGPIQRQESGSGGGGKRSAVVNFG